MTVPVVFCVDVSVIPAQWLPSIRVDESYARHPGFGSLPVLSHRARPAEPGKTTEETTDGEGRQETVPTSLTPAQLPMTGRLATSTPRNGRGLAIRSRLWLVRPAYPAIRPPSIAVSGGEPLRPGSSGLYGHSIRTPRACQAPFFTGNSAGYGRRPASRSSRASRPSPAARGEIGRMCLLSQPFLTRTLRRFTCLPIGSPLASVGVVSWRCRTSRWR